MSKKIIMDLLISTFAIIFVSKIIGLSWLISLLSAGAFSVALLLSSVGL